MGYDFILSPLMIKTLYRRLLIGGFTNAEASNLIANLMGLGPDEKGWTTKELIRLLEVEYRDKKETAK